MKFSPRQKQIIQIVKENEPISGDDIAKKIGFTKSTLRSDFAILTMTGILDARPKVGYIYSGLTTSSLIQDSLSEYLVSDIMLPPALIYQDKTIEDAVTQLFMYDIGTLFVIDSSDELVGIVSRKDLLRSLVGNMHSQAVALSMTRMPNIVSTKPDHTILKAASLLSKHQVDTLPVIDNNGDIVGKLDLTAIIDLIVDISLEEK
ncbi:CBS domain-containing protein [Aerococcaceae bacterium DSM 111020]|nr:CBS domain-containing protein [Aerococcaceae bacterium DSM 111020]